MSTTPNSSILDNISQTTSNITKSIEEQAKSLQQNVSGKLNEFSNTTNAAVSGSTSNSFADSNGIIAKFGFFILVIICFLIALNLGIQLISFFLTKPSIVYIINGMIDGTSKTVILQNPNEKDSKIIRRSNNAITGIEFSWSVWLRLDGISSSSTTDYQNIFVKGDGTNTNAPGVYLSKTNSLRIMIDTSSEYSSKVTSPSTQIIDISNIPMKKWFHLLVRCQNKYLDVYINGMVAYRTNLINVPLQNYDNVIVCNNGGFIGKLSNLIYYDRALNSVDINGLVNSGVNTSDIENKGSVGNVGSNYLSTLWYQ